MEHSGAGGKLIHEKNQKQKISWHCPFKHEDNFLVLPFSRTVQCTLGSSDFDIFLETQYASCVFGLALKS